MMSSYGHAVRRRASFLLALDLKGSSGWKQLPNHVAAFVAEKSVRNSVCYYKRYIEQREE